MPTGSRIRTIGALIGAAVVTASLALLLGAEFALMAAPAVVLGMLLWSGIAPGEQLIERLRRRLRRPRLRAVRRLTAPRLPVVVRPVGRRLADALAMRPPPVARPATCR